MNIKYLLLSLALFMSVSVYSKNINHQQAKNVAVNFYFEKYNQHQEQLAYKSVDISSTYVDKDGSQVYYYVFQFNSGGFVMVSAEDCLTPVLGYSFDSEYKEENQPENIQAWMEQYRKQIREARLSISKATAEISQLWNHYLNTDVSEFNIAQKSKGTGYLMTTKWNQSWPYNVLCPIGEGGQAVSGCVATGYAQCLYYWRFPEHGTGTYCYTHDVYGQLCADFGSTYYRWDEMSDVPRINDTAVGELIYHIGVALDMNYSPESSGTWMYPEQMEEHFNVSTDLQWVERDNYSDSQWKNLIMQQIDLGYVLPYVGFGDVGGHLWVCDGYQDEDYFHMNWGWGGSQDGFFTIDNLQGFYYGQSMGINFYPDAETWDYPYYASGDKILTYLEGSISDGSGPVNDYSNNSQATWLIDPQTQNDSISSIILNIKRFGIATDGDYLKIYNGGDNTAPLLVELTGDEMPDEIVSTSNQVYIEFFSNGDNTAEGFYMTYKCETAVFCEEVTQMTEPTAIISDGSGSFNYSNNSFCLWMIDPGVEAPLSLNFNYFNTESDKDILRVYDGTSYEILAEISGNYDSAPESIISESGKMILRFVTNSDVQYQGWEAWYDVSTGLEEKTHVDFQMVPNPVSSQMYIRFDLKENKEVKIVITDILGHQLMLVSDKELCSGTQNISVDLGDFIKGIYICRIQIADKVSTKKIMKY